MLAGPAPYSFTLNIGNRLAIYLKMPSAILISAQKSSNFINWGWKFNYLEIEV